MRLVAEADSGFKELAEGSDLRLTISVGSSIAGVEGGGRGRRGGR